MNNEKTRHPKRIGEGVKTAFYIILMVFFQSFFLASAANAEINVSATVDRNSLNPDDSLTLTVSIDSTDEASTAQPTLPKLNDFEVLNEWTSQAWQGRMVQTPQGPQFSRVNSSKYNFMLQPKRKGKLIIGSVEVVVDGKAYNTKPITVDVAPGAGMQGRSKQGRQRAAPPGWPGGAFPRPDLFDDDDDDLFSQLLRRQQPPPGSRTLPMNPKDAFFIQVDTDKTDAYVGEQVTVSFYLYTRGLIRDLDTLKYPSLKGFWKEDIEIATHLNFEQEIVNGVPYKKALLASYALFPIKEGSVTIDPYTTKCSVIPTSDGFGFGIGKAYTYTKSSQPVKINVKPVPVEGRPADFSGAVGDFHVTARVEDKAITEGQPLTFKIRFEGRGNAKLIDLPPFQAPEGLELYDQQNEARYFRTGLSYKEFRVLMIPRREGELTIPGVSVSIFDPHSKAYVKKTTEPIQIHVGKGTGQRAASLGLAEGKGAKKPDEQPVLITTWHESSQASLANRTIGYTGLFGVVILILLWRARVDLGWGQRKTDLMRRLKVRMRRVEAKAASGDWRGVGTEMMNTVYFVLGEITGEGGAHLELEKLMLKAPPSVRRELAAPLEKQMEIFQILTFAPETVVGGLKNPDQLKKAINEMEALMAKAVSLGLSAEQSDGSESGPRAS